jgi:hypothetical protein
MRGAVGLAAIAAIFVAGSSLAAEQTSAPPNDPNEVVCKSMPSETGSRLGRTRQCMTRREWDERRKQDREMTERTQAQDSRNPAP